MNRGACQRLPLLVALSDRTPSLTERLSSALPTHFRADKPFRDSHRALVCSYAGRTTYPEYKDRMTASELEANKEILPNTFQACEAFVMNLSASQPRFLVTSPYPQYTPFANRLSRALDRYAEQLYLAEILQDIARNCYFSVGIAKVFQASSPAIFLESDYRSDPGRPFVQSIALKNFVRDTGSDCPEEAAFLGDLYEVSYREAIKSKRFPRWVREELRKIGPEGRRTNDEEDQTDELTRVDDTITLCDVFIRSRKAVWTFVCDRQFKLRHNEPIQKVTWRGSECGPYYFLNMGPAPGHFYPSSPGQNGMLLNNFENSLYRKLEDQAMRQKIIGTAGSPEDATRARDLQDGEYAHFDHPEQVTNIRMDGPDQNLFGLYKDVQKNYSAANNNLEMQLGVAQQADTATQERMLQSNVSRVQAFYQERWVSFVRRVAAGLSRLIWEDAELKIPGKLQIPGTGIEVNDDLLPAKEAGSRVGTFDLYSINIDPYSMGYQSPSQRAAFIQQQVQMWMPYAPFLAEQGKQIDLDVYFEEMANLSNNSVLTRIFKSNQAPMQPDGPMHDRVLDSSSTREYIHRSPGGGDQQEDAGAYFSAPQSSEAA